MGGETVAASLRLAGFETSTPNVALIETVSPRTPLSTILVQSAWNVIPYGEFVKRIKPYPMRMQARAMARREVARVNLRRASKVVCLTQVMATITAEHTGREVVFSPVSLPLDAVGRERASAGRGDRIAIVPGTITWYKRPDLAIAWVARHRDVVDEVVFLGVDDGSGCKLEIERIARRRNIRCRFDLVGREKLYAYMHSAEFVLLPSSLESVGFALSEALWMTPRVVASAIPSHRELAARLGRLPIWLDASPPAEGLVSFDAGTVVTEWQALGRQLGLARGGSGGNGFRGWASLRDENS